jgi:putative Holliday junction resolvase
MPQQLNRTFLAIDYGSRRIGLAKSDPMGIIASALKTLEVKSIADALEQLSRVLDEYKPDALVFGYPLLASGDVSDKCREIDRFIERISRLYDGPVHKVDERHSSVEAAKILHAHGKKTGSDKRRVDRLAAVIILQRFLEENPAI